MTKLFPDSETFTTVRPTKITAQQKALFIASCAQDIISNGFSKSPLDSIIYDLTDIDLSDGYEAAKELEQYGQSSYNINSMFIEFLEGMDSEKDKLVRNNVKDWVKAHNITPKWEKGSQLTVNTPIYYFSSIGDIVYITGVDKERAVYYIDKDRDKNGGYVIPFERIESNCALITVE